MVLTVVQDYWLGNSQELKHDREAEKKVLRSKYPNSFSWSASLSNGHICTVREIVHGLLFYQECHNDQINHFY